jgi:hypothetical protein
MGAMMQRVALGQYRRPVAMALLALGASCATTADEEGDAWRPPVDAGLEAVGRCAPGLASAQFRAEVTPPEFMVPGGRARVSVTFDNCSGAPWPAGEFSLVPAPGTAGAFGVPRVALPADTPTTTPICIASNADGWASHTPLTRDGDVAYGTIEVPRGEYVYYKYTRGDWDTVEKWPGCAEATNRYELGRAGEKSDTVYGWADACL